jgi:hypothetical protein
MEILTKKGQSHKHFGTERLGGITHEVDPAVAAEMISCGCGQVSKKDEKSLKNYTKELKKR